MSHIAYPTKNERKLENSIGSDSFTNLYASTKVEIILEMDDMQTKMSLWNLQRVQLEFPNRPKDEKIILQTWQMGQVNQDTGNSKQVTSMLG